MVEEKDATFILSLRTNERYAKYLSPTENSLTQQIEWIRDYKKREAEGTEYYFLFENNQGTPLGVIRLYNFEADTYTSGSWLIVPESDEMIAISSDLFVLDFALNQLGFNKCIIDVVKQNKKVLRYHNRFCKQFDEDENKVYLIMDKEGHQQKYQFLISILQQ